MAKHVVEDNLKTLGGNSILGLGDIPLPTGAAPDNSTLSLNDYGKLQLGDDNGIITIDKSSEDGLVTANFVTTYNAQGITEVLNTNGDFANISETSSKGGMYYSSLNIDSQQNIGSFAENIFKDYSGARVEQTVQIDGRQSNFNQGISDGSYSLITHTRATDDSGRDVTGGHSVDIIDSSLTKVDFIDNIDSRTDNALKLTPGGYENKVTINNSEVSTKLTESLHEVSANVNTVLDLKDVVLNADSLNLNTPVTFKEGTFKTVGGQSILGAGDIPISADVEVGDGLSKTADGKIQLGIVLGDGTHIRPKPGNALTIVTENAGISFAASFIGVSGVGFTTTQYTASLTYQPAGKARCHIGVGTYDGSTYGVFIESNGQAITDVVGVILDLQARVSALEANKNL